MARAPDNPDRNFSSDGDPEKSEHDKRPADQTQVGEIFDAEARRRFGEVIAASLNPKKPRRRK